MMRVGIDLGTTSTIVSYIDENGMWQVINFSEGTGSRDDPRLLPSAVAIDRNLIVVGQKAADRSLVSPDVLSGIKRDMPDPDEVFIAGGREITPKTAASYILGEVRRELSKRFRGETFNAFVTVPAKFGRAAREATRSALRTAGFETDACCLTDEPIAAAISYSERLDGDKLVLVADFGGGTFDLSLLKTCIVNSANTVDRLVPVAWGGALDLGGNDVDAILLKKMSDCFERESGVRLFKGGEKSNEKIRFAGGGEAEKRAASILISKALELKKELYAEGSTRASAYAENLLNGFNLDFKITREEYLNEMRDISARLTGYLNSIFDGTPYAPEDVDHVLVAGGMAREICLRDILSYTYGDRVIIPEDPILMVSKGAAICTSNLRVHVDNIAYTSIGILKNGGRSVETIIREGESVEPGMVFKAEVIPDNPSANAVLIEIAEFSGQFDPTNYTLILSETVQLMHVRGNMRSFRFHSAGKRPVHELEIVFNEDKLLDISFKQPDGHITRLALRLGGK